eukprot:XP_014618817.1 uncharacterized protein LOC100797406 isoform X2 [Glycine max]
MFTPLSSLHTSTHSSLHTSAHSSLSVSPQRFQELLSPVPALTHLSAGTLFSQRFRELRSRPTVSFPCDFDPHSRCATLLPKTSALVQLPAVISGDCIGKEEEKEVSPSALFRKRCRSQARWLQRNASHKPFLLAMHSHIERILWSEDQISRRVSELAAEISADFGGQSPAPVVVGVATGAFLFLADLVRKIDLSIAVDFVRVESYGFGTVSNGAPTISFDLKVDVNARHVIVVEDIVDTGHTLSKVIGHLKSKGVSSVSVCTFLDKPARRKVHFQLLGEGKYYRGFECPDYFVVGYGLDFAELYRNLPYIGVLKPELYK